ncbi:MAG: hypothetical protein U1E83_08400 [Methylotetracoccus sp.]
MKTHALKLAAVAALGLAPFAANAHECRSLGLANGQGYYDAKNPQNSKPVPDQYWLCIGFGAEDPAHGLPGAGAPNNIDVFPLWAPGKDFGTYASLDTAKGDVVKLKANLYWLSDYVFDLPNVCAWPYDQANCPGIQPATLFFRQLNVAYDNKGNPTAKGTTGYGYEQPIALDKDGKPVFEVPITKFKKVDWEGFWDYKSPKDFVLPSMGSYAFVVSGTLQKKGKAAVNFESKWTCQAPRIPYGPWNLNDIEGTLSAAPEGYFDCVRYDLTAPTSGNRAGHASPKFTEIMSRNGYTPSKN